jgi:GDPmannose 4,6-dehydratase
MWLMLQQDEPGDYVIGTGVGHSLGEFVKEAFNYVGLDWEKYLRKDPRPHDSGAGLALIADASKAKNKLGWEPKVTFKELIQIMVDVDMETLGLIPPGAGKAVLTRYKLDINDRGSGTIGRLEEWPNLKKF